MVMICNKSINKSPPFHLKTTSMTSSRILQSLNRWFLLTPNGAIRIDIALAFGACVVFSNSKTEGSDSLARGFAPQNCPKFSEKPNDFSLEKGRSRLLVSGRVYTFYIFIYVYMFFQWVDVVFAQGLITYFADVT